MGLIRKIPAWLIGGIIGVLYFLATYLIDIGTCEFSHKCSGSTGLVTFILNTPAVAIMTIFGVGSIYAIPVVDFVLGALAGFIIGKIIKIFKK